MQKPFVVTEARDDASAVALLDANGAHATRDTVLSPAFHLLITVDGRGVVRSRAAEVRTHLALIGVGAGVHDYWFAGNREFEAQKVTVSVAQHIGRTGLPREEYQGCAPVVELVEAGIGEGSLGVVGLVAVDVAASAGKRPAFLGDPVGRVVEEGVLPMPRSIEAMASSICRALEATFVGAALPTERYASSTRRRPSRMSLWYIMERS